MNSLNKQILEAIKKNGIDVHILPKEQADKFLKELTDTEKSKVFKQIQPAKKQMFYSNALLALQNIKQDKATPQQWLAMLNKNGGIKKDEDKWIGLTEWFHSQKQPTLSKSEITDYILKNQLQIQDVVYTDSLSEDSNEILDGFNQQWYEYMAEGEEFTNSVYTGDHAEYAWNKMVEEYGQEFEEAFEMVNEHGSYALAPTVDFDDELTEAAARFLQAHHIINPTRKQYTTTGLEEYKEIALVVPTIEPWNKDDKIHFGDAGEGRAIAWIRFGTTYQNSSLSNEEMQRQIDAMPGIEIWDKSPATENKLGKDIYYPPTEKNKSFRDCIIDCGNGQFEINGPCASKLLYTRYYSIEDAVKAYNKYIFKQQMADKEKILVIDEIQSKRHQDAHKNIGKDGEKKKLGYIPKGIYTQMEKLNREKITALNEYYETLRGIKILKELRDIKIIKEYGDKGIPDKVINEWMDEFPELKEKHARMKETIRLAADFRIKHKMKEDVPIEAPFEKNWHELCMKRMMAYAAENGYDKITWTTGEEQAERYSLGTMVSEIQIDRIWEDGERSIVIVGAKDNYHYNLDIDKEGIITADDRQGLSEFSGKCVFDVFGKNIGDFIMNGEEGSSIDGKEQHLGGETTKYFYNKTLPSFMNKYGKKWGVVTTQTKLNLQGVKIPFHSVDVTPEMKQSVMQGQPMFLLDKKGHVLGLAVENRIYLMEDGLNPETMLHEYTHIWANAMRYGNKEGWNSIKSLLKDTPIWNEIKENPLYADIKYNEDYLTSEVLAHISGRENSAKLGKMSEEKNLMNRIREALQKFWAWVGVHMFDIKKFNTISEITDRVLYDLAKGNRLETEKPIIEAEKPVMNRLSHVMVFEGMDGNFYIRGKIDGVQQTAQKIKQEEMELCNAENINELAEKYYSKQLGNERINHGRKL